jgi:hypothetical protein
MSKMRCIVGVSKLTDGTYRFLYIHKDEDKDFYKYTITFNDNSTAEKLTPAEIQSHILLGKEIISVKAFSLGYEWGGSKRTAKRSSRNKRTSKRRNKSRTRRYRK